MELAQTSDQRAIINALDSLLNRFEPAPLHDAPLAATDPELERELGQAGFLDVAADPDLGTATAALVVERLARSPFAIEAAASAFVRPLLDDAPAGPICLVDARHWRRPVRFLATGTIVLVLEEDRVTRFEAGESDVRAQPDALFAYPVATLAALPEHRVVSGVDSTILRARWQAALAAECAGLLRAALEATIAHVSDRHQFGRPLATFQAIRHRLAEAQVRTNGVYWLALKAASDCNSVDTAMAALHAQNAARACAYDFHQFLGAMGLTLEHPLHLWTYRLKLLAGELGGTGGQSRDVADGLWGQAATRASEREGSGS